jgi:GNAT superfamily N-acetyltransferase
VVPPDFSPVEKLAPDHDLTRFHCGRRVIDDWLRKWARQSEALDSATTWVACAASSRTVVGFYSLTTGSVTHEDAPKRIRRGMPRYRIPVIILARLGVDLLHQDKKLGRALLMDAMLRVAKAANEVGVRALMVHALDEETRGFYERWGFEQSPLHELQLFLPMKRIRVSLDAAGLLGDAD